MDVLEDVGADDSVQIGVHEVKNEIDIPIILRSYHIL